MCRFSPIADDIVRRPVALSIWLALAIALAAASPADATYLIEEDETEEISVANSENLVVAVVLNGEKLNRPVELNRIGERLLLSSADIAPLGLEHPQDAPQVDLAAIAGLRVEIDRQRLVLRLTTSALDGPNRIDFGGHALRASYRPGKDDRVGPLTALSLKYDVNSTLTDDGISFAGHADLQLGREALAAAGDLQFFHGANGETVARRLNSALSHADRQAMRKITLGDFIAVTGRRGRGIRMGGLEISSDFSLRPDLITYPTVSFDGQAAVPSAVDILVDGRRIEQRTIEAGDFAVRNIPVPSGRGELAIVVRDASGVERVTRAALYSSPKLLRPGLADYSLNLGYLRRDFGRDSFGYGNLAASAHYARGITDRLTLDARSEAGQGLAMAGVGIVYRIGSIGIVDASLAHSRLRKEALAVSGSGWEWTAGFESFGDPFSIAVRATQPQRDFRDMAAVEQGRPAPRRIIGSFSYDLDRAGIVRLGAVHESRYRLDRAEYEHSSVFSASWRANLSSRFNIGLDVNSGGAAGTQLLLGLTTRLGGRSHASVSARRLDGANEASLNLARPDMRAGEFGYRLSASHGVIDRLDGSLAYRAEQARMELSAEHVARAMAARLNARGALIWADGGLFATESGNGSFALVDTNGVEDVAVSHDRNERGRTARNGRMLLTGLRAHERNLVSADPLSLPELTTSGGMEAEVSPYEGGGVRVDLDIRKVHPATILLVDIDGRAIPEGLGVSVNGSAIDIPTVSGGMIYLEDARGAVEVGVTGDDGLICRADLPPMADLAPFSEIGPVTCHPLRRLQTRRIADSQW